MSRLLKEALFTVKEEPFLWSDACFRMSQEKVFSKVLCLLMSIKAALDRQYLMSLTNENEHGKSFLQDLFIYLPLKEFS